MALRRNEKSWDFFARLERELEDKNKKGLKPAHKICFETITLSDSEDSDDVQEVHSPCTNTEIITNDSTNESMAIATQMGKCSISATAQHSPKNIDSNGNSIAITQLITISDDEDESSFNTENDEGMISLNEEVTSTDAIQNNDSNDIVENDSIQMPPIPETLEVDEDHNEVLCDGNGKESMDIINTSELPLISPEKRPFTMQAEFYEDISNDSVYDNMTVPSVTQSLSFEAESQPGIFIISDIPLNSFEIHTMGETITNAQTEDLSGSQDSNSVNMQENYLEINSNLNDNLLPINNETPTILAQQDQIEDVTSRQMKLSNDLIDNSTFEEFVELHQEGNIEICTNRVLDEINPEEIGPEDDSIESLPMEEETAEAIIFESEAANSQDSEIKSQETAISDITQYLSTSNKSIDRTLDDYEELNIDEDPIDDINSRGNLQEEIILKDSEFEQQEMEFFPNVTQQQLSSPKESIRNNILEKSDELFINNVLEFFSKRLHGDYNPEEMYLDDATLKSLPKEKQIPEDLLSYPEIVNSNDSEIRTSPDNTSQNLSTSNESLTKEQSSSLDGLEQLNVEEDFTDIQSGCLSNKEIITEEMDSINDSSVILSMEGERLKDAEFEQQEMQCVSNVTQKQLGSPNNSFCNNNNTIEFINSKRLYDEKNQEEMNSDDDTLKSFPIEKQIPEDLLSQPEEVSSQDSELKNQETAVPGKNSLSLGTCNESIQSTLEEFNKLNIKEDPIDNMNSTGTLLEELVSEDMDSFDDSSVMLSTAVVSSKGSEFENQEEMDSIDNSSVIISTAEVSSKDSECENQEEMDSTDNSSVIISTAVVSSKSSEFENQEEMDSTDDSSNFTSQNFSTHNELTQSTLNDNEELDIEIDTIEDTNSKCLSLEKIVSQDNSEDNSLISFMETENALNSEFEQQEMQYISYDTPPQLNSSIGSLCNMVLKIPYDNIGIQETLFKSRQAFDGENTKNSKFELSATEENSHIKISNFINKKRILDPFYLKNHPVFQSKKRFKFDNKYIKKFKTQKSFEQTEIIPDKEKIDSVTHTDMYESPIGPSNSSECAEHFENIATNHQRSLMPTTQNSPAISPEIHQSITDTREDITEMTFNNNSTSTEKACSSDSNLEQSSKSHSSQDVRITHQLKIIPIQTMLKSNFSPYSTSYCSELMNLSSIGQSNNTLNDEPHRPSTNNDPLPAINYSLPQNIPDPRVNQHRNQQNLIEKKRFLEKNNIITKFVFMLNKRHIDNVKRKHNLA